jgi:hypothetical protein
MRHNGKAMRRRAQVQPTPPGWLPWPVCGILINPTQAAAMFDKLPLSGLDLNAPLTVPLWWAGAAAGLLLLLLLVALFRGGLSAVIGSLVRIAFLALAMVAAWIVFNWVQDRDRIEARRALDQRLDELRPPWWRHAGRCWPTRQNTPSETRATTRGSRGCVAPCRQIATGSSPRC